jgi:hypothetical protein
VSQNEDVVARLGEGEQRDRHRGETGGDEDRAGGTFELVDRVGECIGGRRATRSIGIFLRPPVHRPGIGKQHRGSVHHRWIDETVIVAGIVAAMGQPGVDAVAVGILPVVVH